MRRIVLFATSALLLAAAAPSSAEGQVSFFGGLGVTQPLSDLSNAAGVGWHGNVGMQLGVASIPIRLRGDGTYHSFGEEGGNPKPKVLAGALSIVVPFPGVGLRPYLLGGIGAYRTTFSGDSIDEESDRGFHGAFGVDIGAPTGLGGYAELRYVDIQSDAPGNRRLISATLGLRL